MVSSQFRRGLNGLANMLVLFLGQDPATATTATATAATIILRFQSRATGQQRAGQQCGDPYLFG